MARYTHHSSFHWQSDLSNERKDELLLWVKSLNVKDLSKLEDLLEDAADTEGSKAAEDAAGDSI